jgi:predicted enzyme related to lactoylglutathione lyase
MSSNFLGLRTVGYTVSDLTKAKEWYSNVLGVQPYFDEPFYVGYNVAGYELGLQPEEEQVTKGDSVVTYWGVEDIDNTYKRLLELGATIHQEPMDVGGDIKVASVKDPWDNIFGVIYNPHFKL